MSSQYYMHNSHRSGASPSVPIYSDYLSKVSNIPSSNPTLRTRYSYQSTDGFRQSSPSSQLDYRRFQMPREHNYDFRQEYRNYDNTGYERQMTSTLQYPSTFHKSSTFTESDSKPRFSSQERINYRRGNTIQPQGAQSRYRTGHEGCQE